MSSLVVLHNQFLFQLFCLLMCEGVILKQSFHLLQKKEVSVLPVKAVPSTNIGILIKSE